MSKSVHLWYLLHGHHNTRERAVPEPGDSYWRAQDPIEALGAYGIVATLLCIMKAVLVEGRWERPRTINAKDIC